MGRQGTAQWEPPVPPAPGRPRVIAAHETLVEIAGYLEALVHLQMLEMRYRPPAGIPRAQWEARIRAAVNPDGIPPESAARPGPSAAPLPPVAPCPGEG